VFLSQEVEKLFFSSSAAENNSLHFSQCSVCVLSLPGRRKDRNTEEVRFSLHLDVLETCTCCCEGSRAACGHQLPLLLRSLNGSKEKFICLSGKAHLEETPAFPSFYQQVENKFTAYLSFVYVNKNMSFFFIKLNIFKVA